MRNLSSLIGGLLFGASLLLQSCGGGNGTNGGATSTASGTGVTGASPAPQGPPSISFITTGGSPFQGIYLPEQHAIFVTNMSLNEVDKISTLDFSVRARIPVVQPIGIDVSADRTRLYVGTGVQTIATIDLMKAQVIAKASPPGFQAPRIPLVLNSGKVLLISSSPGSPQDFIGEGTNAFLWNPADNTFQDRSLGTPFASGPIARSADGSKVIVGSFGVPATIALYDVATDQFVFNRSSPNPIIAVAANSDGTQFAATDAHTVFFFDRNLVQIGTANMPVDFHGMAYTADNRYLFGRWAGAGNPRLFVLDTSTLQTFGFIPSPFAGSPIPFAQDEVGNLLVVASGGVGSIPFRPSLSLSIGPDYPPIPPRWVPGQAPPGQSVSTQLSGNGFETGMQVFFGSVGAATTSLVAGPGGKITVQTPASPAGPANVLFQFPDSWSNLLPASFSYGPTALQLTATGGPSGTPITLFGYGFNFPLSQMQVTIGGQSAILHSAGPSNISTNYPVDQITFFAPSASSGIMDVTLSTPVGSTTIPKAFQYSQKTAIFATPSNLSQIIFDPKRRLVYASSGNLIQVFSPDTMRLLPPIQPPGTAANSQYKGLALTPDSALLVVADGANHSVAVFNPDSPSQGSAIPLTTPSSSRCAPPANSLPFLQPNEVATTKTGKAFIAETIGSIIELDLSTGQFQYRCDVSSFAVQNSLAGTPDGSKVVFADTADTMATVAIWDASTDTFTAQSVGTFSILGDVAVSADGTRVVTTTPDQLDAFTHSSLLDSSLRVVAYPSYPDLSPPIGRWVPGIKLNSSGGLYFLPRQQGIDILDAQTGQVRQQIIMPEPLITPQNVASILNGLALDESTNTLFAISASGLTVMQLAGFPLGIGSVIPSQGPASGGVAITLKGSGFQQGAQVSLGAQTASTVFVDSSTLNVVTPPLSSGAVRVSVTNPDGSIYSLDDAYFAN